MLYDFFDLRVNLFPKIHIVVVFEVDRKLAEGNLVAGLVLAVLFVAVLDGIVGQVHVPVFQVAEVKLVAARSDVTLLEEIASELSSLDDLRHSIHADVEFSERRVVPMRTAQQQRIVNVPLNDPLLVCLLLEKMVNVLFLFKDSDAAASI